LKEGKYEEPYPERAQTENLEEFFSEKKRASG
jgi:hypothetical protein